MEGDNHRTNHTDAEIRGIFDDAERKAMGGWPRAIVRAGLGALFFVLGVHALVDVKTVGLVLACGIVFLILGIYTGASVGQSTLADQRVARHQSEHQGLSGYAKK
jgi:hypothetical protein